jgi:hypothetical protein
MAIGRDLNSLPAVERQRHLVKAIAVGLTYGFPDYALELPDVCDRFIGDARQAYAAAVRHCDEASKQAPVIIQIDLQADQVGR